MKTFNEVAHLYAGCKMRTELGDYTLLGYIDGEYILDTIAYGLGALEAGIKPILYPLSSMSMEQRTNTLRMNGGMWQDEDEAEKTIYLLSQSFDLFNLIPNNEAIDGSKEVENG